MSEDSEHEEGVCVACKSSECICTFDPDGLNLPVCTECREDGSFHEWLTNELERLAPELGMEPCGRTEDGKRNLWRKKTAPRDSLPAGPSKGGA